jgi:hypothetical protein
MSSTTPICGSFPDELNHFGTAVANGHGNEWMKAAEEIPK